MLFALLRRKFDDPWHTESVNCCLTELGLDVIPFASNLHGVPIQVLWQLLVDNHP
jgi:hypothetical protein